MCVQLDFDSYELLAKEINALLEDLPKSIQEEAFRLFQKLDDKMESLLCLKEEGLLPLSFKG